MKTATFIKNISGFNGHAALYQLDPPLKSYEETPYDFVIVSAVVAPFSGPETYIFPATSEGDIVNWEELPGSYRGKLDHEKALSNAGYTLVNQP